MTTPCIIPPIKILETLEGGQIETFNQYRATLLDSTNRSKYLVLDLRGANLANKVIKGANFRSCRFNQSNLGGLIGQECDFSYANLWKVNLSGAILDRSNLRNTNLYYASLQEARLKNADLTFATIQEANLAGADLTDCNLKGADLKQTNLEGVILDGANLTGACFMEAISSPTSRLKNVTLDPEYYPYFALTAPERLKELIERDNPGWRKNIEGQSDQILAERVQLKDYRQQLIDQESDSF